MISRFCLTGGSVRWETTKAGRGKEEEEEEEEEVEVRRER